MTVQGHKILLPKEQMTQGLALAALLLLMGLAIAGPSGLLSWNENSQLLQQRHLQIAALTEERDSLKNRVDLLDPNNVDHDLSGSLIRSNLNLVHPDEVVYALPEAAE